MATPRDGLPFRVMKFCNFVAGGGGTFQHWKHVVPLHVCLREREL